MKLPNGYVWEELGYHTLGEIDILENADWVSTTNSLHVWEEVWKTLDGVYYMTLGAFSSMEVMLYKGVECD